MTYYSRITIEPVKNGFVVTVSGDEEEIYIFARRRQLMHFIGSQIDILSNDKDDE